MEKIRQSFWRIERGSHAFSQKSGEKRGIRGDDFNVVGLPICRLGRMLAQVGEDALAQCAQKCAEKER